MKHISRMPQDKADNKQLFLNIELLDEAVSKQRKITFQYVEYGTDKKLHPQKSPDGPVREYLITPYQMAAKEGKYYLICNLDKYDDISNYRLDRIKDIRILDEPGKPFEKLKWANGQPLDLASYMKEHPYMYASGNVRAKLRVVRAMAGNMIDMFGHDIAFSDESSTHVTASVFANEMALEQFAKNFSPDVVVLEPEGVRQRIRENLEKSLVIYKKGRD